MDPRKITPVKLSMSQVRDTAEDFRKGHIFNYNIPVEIERVIEVTKGICIIPIESLHKDCDMDGFISRDFSTIYVDKDHYIDDRYYRRVRFTIAHEIGHLIMHREVIDMVKFTSDSEWKKFRMNLQDEPLGWFETQASEFAGRLLVPFDHLVICFKDTRKEIIKENSGWDAPTIEEDEMLSQIASRIAPKFDVSAEVIYKRMVKEKVMSLIS